MGDCPFSEPLRAIVNAAREALVNAAKHAGTGKVDLYVEITPAAVEVFVRDRGVGFDPADVPEDRMGVRGSIVDRMDRHGGTAEVRSTQGEGTEVRLRLPRKNEENHDEQQAGQKVRVVIVDDHAMFRVGVKCRARRRRGRGRRGYDVDSAVATIGQQQPAVVLLDVHLPGGGGVEVIRRAQAPTRATSRCRSATPPRT